MNELEFMKKFEPKSTCIKEFDYWIVCARKKARTLGDAVILLKREIDSISNMKKEEAEEYPKVIKWYEKTCYDKFGASKFNYYMLMMKDNFVHFHAFPRYENDIEKFDIIWKDEDYPLVINMNQAKEIKNDILEKMIKYMQQ